ncbi:BrnT family toxin [Candidatus Daviesbacteria bacterium]|nr:BrnT family toxin [Candidatus Daviesbacteria bacterium]
MKYYDWDEEKNARLTEEREVSFEEVVDAIEDNRILDRIDHPNKKRYPNQKIMIIRINNYAFMAPFVEEKEKIFFKTIIPSREMTKKYLIKEDK